MEKYIAAVRSWMINDKLMLNDDETEFMVIGTSNQLSECLLVVLGSGRGRRCNFRIFGKKSGLLVRLAHGYGNAYNKDLW